MNEENINSTFRENSYNTPQVPQIDLCFEKLDRGPSSSFVEQKEAENVSSSRFSPIKSQASRKKSTQKLTKLEKNNKRGKKFQESKMAALISNIGKFIIFVRHVKKSIECKEMKNISTKQLDIIDDKAFPKEIFEEKRRRDFFFEKFVVRNPLFKFIWSMLVFIEENVWKKHIIKWSLKIPVFLPTNRFILTWKLLLCLAVLFQLLFVPIDLFFKRNPEKTIPIPFEWFLHAVLWVDMIVEGNVAIYKRGELILNRRLIIKKYISSQLPFNIFTLGCLHFEWGGSSIDPQFFNSSLNLLRMGFYLRMAQVSNLFTQVEELMHNDETYEALLALLRLFLQIFFITHIFCCFWNYAAFYCHKRGERTWQDSLFYSDEKQEEVTLERAYLYSFYWSLTTVITVGYGDISPKNDTELLVCSFAMLFGSGFFAYGINKIGVIFENLEKKRLDFKEEFRVIDNFMQRKKIDYTLQIKVFKFLEHLFNQSKSLGNENESKVLSKLSQNLRKDLLVQANGSLLEKFSVFNHILSKETLNRLSQKVRTINFAPEELVFYKGQTDDNSLFFLLTGEVEIYVSGMEELEAQKSVRMVEVGECFGHEGFFLRNARSFSARSKTFSSVMAISEDEFRNIVKEMHHDWEKFCMLRDKIFLYSEYSNMHNGCESCGEKNHTFFNCPYLHYIPKRNLILSKYIYNEEQSRRKVLREKKEKSKNALFYNFKPVVFNSKSIASNDNTDSSQEFCESESPQSQDDEESEIEFPRENNRYRRSDMRRKLFIKSSSMKSNPLNDDKEGSEGADLILKSSSFGKEELRKPQARKNSINPLEKLADPTAQDSLPTIFGGINTEKMCSFQHYFPYNNCEEVIKFFDAFNRRDSPLKTKIKNNSDHFTPRTVGREAGARNFAKTNRGLIQFRNMQRFFLKSSKTKKK